MQTIDLSSYEPGVGTDIDAVQIDNGLALVQTRYNDLVSDLSGGAAGKVLHGVSTTLTWSYPAGYEYDYKEITASVSITATSFASANVVIAADSVTFDGTPVWVEFYSPEVQPTSADTLSVYLHDDTAAVSLGRLGAFLFPAGTVAQPTLLRRRFTPAAGARTLSVRAFTNSGTASIGAGTGGALVASDMPAYIRITKA